MKQFDNLRSAKLSRETMETKVRVALNLDGEGLIKVQLGIPFVEHMLILMGYRAGLNLEIEATGDLDVDDHHVTEDVAIVLGKTFLMALGKKMGIRRYGSVMMPMDEVLVAVAVDISGRSCFVSNYSPKRESVGALSTEMISHFFRTFSAEARITLHMNFLNQGENEHHRVEALFKGVGQALGQAIERVDGRSGVVPSTKGVLEGSG